MENTFIGGEITRRGLMTDIWIGLAGNGTSLRRWINGNVLACLFIGNTAVQFTISLSLNTRILY